MQLTTASKVPIGFLFNGTTISPFTVTETLPGRSTDPVAETMLHGAPPPGIPRSVAGPSAAPVTGVMESNSTSVPSLAPALTVLPPTRLSAPTAPTRNLRPIAMQQPSTPADSNATTHRPVLP